MIVFGIAVVIALIVFVIAVKLGSNDSRYDPNRAAGDAGGGGDAGFAVDSGSSASACGSDGGGDGGGCD